ncbi:MAG: hypothetical protein M3R65_09100 [Gemmatimonadota bacterium]|nr:hypothetical protein [Gemmatimonadota bacterium]
MTSLSNRATWRTAGFLSLALLASACSNIKDQLLAPQQPNVISPNDIQSATGADGLYVGAVGRFEVSLDGSPNNSGSNQEAAWNWAGLFSDEFKSADTFSQRNDADQRNLQDNDANVTQIYAGLQQGRGYARTALQALQKFEPTSTAKIGEMYFDIGFLELTLGQEFCNGIPLGFTVGGQPQYTSPLTTQQVFVTASTKFDSALTAVAAGSDAASNAVRNATLVAKARDLVDQGQYAAAATLVGPVATSFQFTVDYSNTTVDNEWWVLGPSVKRYSLGDSIDVSGPVLNATPFVSLKDPRVLVDRTVSGGPGEDNSTVFNWPSVLSGRDAPLVIASGIDARLIEAEAKLQTGDYAGMVATLNALRAVSQTIGTFVVPVLPPITTVPATQNDAINLLFREKALWQFGRGVRMDDLRRLVRQYGRPQNTVFPSGTFFKTGTYGTEVAFPVPDAERTNPLFKGCIDRNA